MVDREISRVAAAARETRARSRLRPGHGRPIPPRHALPALAPRQAAAAVHVRAARARTSARETRRGNAGPAEAARSADRGLLEDDVTGTGILVGDDLAVFRDHLSILFGLARRVAGALRTGSDLAGHGALLARMDPA